jgi:hypothetical protein
MSWSQAIEELIQFVPVSLEPCEKLKARGVDAPCKEVFDWREDCSLSWRCRQQCGRFGVGDEWAERVFNP